MPEEIDLQKLKEEYPEFFKKIPAEVIDFILSKETAAKIEGICIQNGIRDEKKIEGIAYRIALVLLGKLPKENLALTLREGLGLDLDTAQRVSLQARELISSRPPLVGNEKPVPAPPLPKEKPLEEPQKPPKKDAYHEPVG